MKKNPKLFFGKNVVQFLHVKYLVIIKWKHDSDIFLNSIGDYLST